MGVGWEVRPFPGAKCTRFLAVSGLVVRAFALVCARGLRLAPGVLFVFVTAHFCHRSFPRVRDFPLRSFPRRRRSTPTWTSGVSRAATLRAPDPATCTRAPRGARGRAGPGGSVLPGAAGP